jgi:hypothetical protein
VPGIWANQAQDESFFVFDMTIFSSIGLFRIGGIMCFSPLTSLNAVYFNSVLSDCFNFNSLSTAAHVVPFAAASASADAAHAW